MRFSNDDYLKAFPRDEEKKTVIKDQPGNSLEEVEKKTTPEDPEDQEDQEQEEPENEEKEEQ